MIKLLMQELRPTLVLFVLLTGLTGVLYPYAVTGVAQGLFPFQANGSLLEREQTVIGSALIGQHFSGASYFWSRPSGTAPMPYNASASSGANFAASNPAYREALQTRLNDLAQSGMPASQAHPAPADLVATSASGLDPDISLAAAQFQLARVAQARDVPVTKIQALLEAHTEQPWLGWLGEARVNVLKLNLALDQAYPLSPGAKLTAPAEKR